MTRKWLEQVAGQSLGYIETLEATYDIARSVLARGIPGDLVECGVFAGAHCAVMARAIWEQAYYVGGDELDHEVGGEGILSSEQLRPYSRRVHLFDSFQGLPAASELDQEIWAHHGAKTGEATCSLEHVKANMKAWGIPDELLVYHPGWFAETIPHALRFALPTQLKAIAILRLDGDLYSSTKECMELYSLVSNGGWVICDDYNLSGFRKALHEVVMPAPIYFRLPTK